MAILGKIIKRGSQLRHRLEQRRLSPEQLQRKTLRRLLRKASETSFGQYYKFKKILKSPDIVEAFQASVPIYDYDKIYQEWWHLALNQVENVCWKGRVKYFALSSGTSGAPSKHIPVTDDMLRAIRRAGLKMLYSLTTYDVPDDLYAKNMLMLGGSSSLEDKGDFFAGDLSGINVSRLPLWMRRIYRPGLDIARIRDWNERLDEIARQAPNWDVGFIMGIPAWILLMIEKIMVTHQLDSIHDIWPNLRVYVHGGVAFSPYRKAFDKLMKHPMIYLDTYLASEGFMAFQNRPGTEAMALLPNNGIFFEFIPFDEEHFDAAGQPLPWAKTITLHEVEEQRDYALILSTCAGAWRYLIGDTIRFTDKSRLEIIITGRTKHFLSICGEHLSVDNMNQALRQVEEQLGLSIREFTVAGVEVGQYFAHRWYLACDQPVDKSIVAKALDEALMAINDDYRTERGAVLKDLQLELIPTQLFYAYQESLGKMGGQNKFPRVMSEDRFAAWETFVQQQQPV